MLHDYVRADVLGGPLPSPRLPGDTIQLTSVEMLGKLILYDSTLSNPPGYSCATCHVPETGFTGPNSEINAFAGPQPGIVPGRFSDRKPQSYLYAAFSPEGPYYDPYCRFGWAGISGKAAFPILLNRGCSHPSTRTRWRMPPRDVILPLREGIRPSLFQKLANEPCTSLFKQVYGQDVFHVYSSKQIYDSSVRHSLHTNPRERSARSARSTMPPNMGRHRETCIRSPHPRNADIGIAVHGERVLDYGLGANPNPAPDGTRFYKNVPGDIPEFRGLFKAPSLRGTDKRPSPDFVKAYMHNGVFKSLKDVVHFHNKRNIAVDASGKEIAFDLRKGPPSGYTPLFPPPEVLENVQNAAGVPPVQATSAIESNGQIGNLQLSSQEEADLVSFLKILNDGYTKPNPVSP